MKRHRDNILSIDRISHKVRENGTDETRNILKMLTEYFSVNIPSFDAHREWCAVLLLDRACSVIRGRSD